MNKEFVPYQEALELKELGFDEPCFGYYESTYGKEKVIIEPSKLITNSNYSKVFSEIRYRIVTPTFSQAFRWFREKYNIPSNLELLEGGWDYVVYTDVEKEINYGDGPFQTYEEAELACLRKLIEIVEQINRHGTKH